ncbi:MAG: acetolactate synthase catalytic subunit [Acetobacteraceae bacterium]|nr:acetolactate synthase catalytic subunit [Acetobacteraceae bacterium]
MPVFDDAKPAVAAGGNATVALRLAEGFRRHGVTLTFGQSLPSAFHLACPAVGIEQKPYRQENAGGAMADGYARIARKVGVVTAQNGPAATLLVAPLAEALKASVPVLALVQEVTRDSVDRNAFQELDHLAMFAPVAKWVRRLDRADRLDDYVDMAFTAAASGRPGPAVLLAPADLLTETAAARAALLRPRVMSLGDVPLDRTVADPVAVDAAADALAAAEHPLVVAGGGVLMSGAMPELRALQDAAHLPVATTVMGKGAADETHPLTLGIAGYVMGQGTRTHALRPMVERADVVLLVGTRTNQNGTDSWRLFGPETRFIHLDTDPMEIGRNYESQRLLGDAKLTLGALAAALRKRDLGRRAAARPAVEREIAASVAAWHATMQGLLARDAPLCRPERVMAELDALIGPEDVVVADASYASIWIANYLTAKRAGQRFLTPRGIAGLGWGLPMAIGAQVALAEMGSAGRVVCLCGDGGFAHSWAELETLRRLELPVTVIVLNNGILGYQKHAEEVRFGEHTIAVNFAAVDHAAIARACGVAGVRVEGGAAIAPALRDALDARAPVLLDVITDPDAKPPISAFAGHYPEPF